MSLSNPFLIIRVTVVLAICLISHAANAQVNSCCFGTAKKAVTELYPELKGHGLHVVVEDHSFFDTPTTGLSDFSLHLYRPSDDFPPAADCRTENKESQIILRGKCGEIQLSIRFLFPVTGDDRISELEASGEGVRNPRSFEVSKLVDAHQEWSNPDIEKSLRNAGARFGPWAREEVIRALPVDALKILLHDFQVVSVDFSYRVQNETDLSWSVILISHEPGRPDQKYLALVEPFGGKLVYLSAITN